MHNSKSEIIWFFFFKFAVNFRQELRHEFKHLQDYERHLVNHCDTARMWLGHYKTTVEQNIQFLKGLLRTQSPQVDAFITRMKLNVDDLIGHKDEVFLYVKLKSNSSMFYLNIYQIDIKTKFTVPEMQQ